MVNLICQIECPWFWSNMIHTIVWGYFWIKLTSELVDWVLQLFLHMWVGLTQAYGRLNRTKYRLRKNFLSLPDFLLLGKQPLPVIGLEFILWVLLVLRPFSLDWKYSYGSCTPGSCVQIPSYESLCRVWYKKCSRRTEF